jgi:hypothetical protein
MQMSHMLARRYPALGTMRLQQPHGRVSSLETSDIDHDLGKLQCKVDHIACMFVGPGTISYDAVAGSSQAPTSRYLGAFPARMWLLARL